MKKRPFSLDIVGPSAGEYSASVVEVRTVERPDRLFAVITFALDSDPPFSVADFAMMQGESLEARPTMVLRCMRRRRMTLPEPSSPTTLQLFLPRSMPRTAISMDAPLASESPPYQLSRRGGPSIRGIHQRALGRSRGGFTSKIHCLGDARGRPIAFDLTPGEAADCKTYDTLIDLPEQTPDALLADKAHDTDAIRSDLKSRGIKAVIPPKSNRTTAIRYSKRLYRQRNCIERMIGHLKINRAIATRYDQLADSFLGMLYIATARYWIKFVHAPRPFLMREKLIKLRV